MVHDPVIDPVGDILVVRDDLLPGGTKMRAIPALFASLQAQEYVYASPAYGYAQIALALAGQAYHKRITIFCAARKRWHRRTVQAAQAGAHIVEVPYGYLSVVQARARTYCAVTQACLLPFGLDAPVVVDALTDVARDLPIVPTEVWTVAGSGTLNRALQHAWPGATVHAVQIGARPKVGRAIVWAAPERFEHDAELPPPFSSCGNYDAKAWRFIKQHAQPGALFWNVAG